MVARSSCKRQGKLYNNADAQTLDHTLLGISHD